MAGTAEALANWAHQYVPDGDDLALARRALADTLAVALAARDHPVTSVAAGLPDAARWAAVGHVLDFDDLHVESTTHISVVVVPAVLSVGGDARAYLAGAGVMARLGMRLGWRHYSSGWHATCTAGASAAAVAAGTALDLSPGELAAAIALAVPGSGGVRAAFGTHAKSLQAGFAAEAGVRAARLARAGATADPRALDSWLALVGATEPEPLPDRPAVPGGLAIKMFPCCYAMQRPIAAVRELRGAFEDAAVRGVRVEAVDSTLRPLIHDRPRTGLEGKFSLPYAVAAAILDDYPGFASFTDAAVGRAAATRLMSVVRVEPEPGGSGLLAGQTGIQIELGGGETLRGRLAEPPGSPRRPPSTAELESKLAACGPDVPELLTDITWDSAAELMRTVFPADTRS